MNKEIQSIIQALQQTLHGKCWYGRGVFEILNEVDETKVYIKPNANSHSLAELLYHMLTWAEFIQKRLEKEPIQDMAAFEAMDWRTIDPAEHTWKKGVAALKTAHAKIIELLQTKDDALLKEIVDYRKYDFGFMLNGLIQHNIYHLGQIAYVKKFLL
jgi:uncharacterized damage-inducible protein DinB